MSVVEILTRKFVAGNGNVKCREILEFRGFDIFPKEGEEGEGVACNHMSMCKTNLGCHVFDANIGEVRWKNSDDDEIKEYIYMKKPSKVIIGGGFRFAGVHVGSTWPEEMFQAIAEDIRKEKDRILESWSGTESVKI